MSGERGVVRLRLSGEPEEVTAVLATLAAAGVEVAWDGRTYPNRSGFGVRAYAETRPAEVDHASDTHRPRR
ncbi:MULTISPECIES: hypothetical protein [Nocardia]|uniref:hypothetical protein n=1 Tax=Nocardia TaxID=1817 RepID=UPI002457E8FE|nr:MULTISPECIES: hypothetical protein [Nocardia]